LSVVLFVGLRAATRPPADEHHAGRDGQQSAGEEGAAHVGERQNQSSERGARRDTGVVGAGVRRECDLRAARCAMQHCVLGGHEHRPERAAHQYQEHHGRYPLIVDTLIIGS
jgi:hypothetical protein